MRLGLGLGIDTSKVLGGVPSYTPASDTELVDWWDAQNGVTTSGGELRAWTGSVNSETSNPPTVTSRPLYGTNQINSSDVLTFRSSDPNYLQLSSTSAQSGLCVHMVIDITNANGVIISIINSGGEFIRYLSGNSGKADNNGNLGGSIEYYVNGSSIGNDITRAQLYTGLNAGSVVLTLDGVNTTGLDDLIVGARGNVSLGISGDIGDVIVSTGNTFLSDNVDFLMNKYNIA